MTDGFTKNLSDALATVQKELGITNTTVVGNLDDIVSSLANKLVNEFKIHQ